MLFWIFVILMIIGIVLVIVGDYISDGFEDGLFAFGGAVSILSFLVVVCMLAFIIVEHTGVDGYIAKMHARREVLVYQLENNVYENDNDLGKRELMTEIQEWNESIARCREVQDDFWVGIFHADIYDQFELIPLE